MRGAADTRKLVLEFWRLMATNNFALTSAVLSNDFVLEWPQSKERIRGAEKFARMNSEYPAHGRWQFEIHRLVSDENQAVTDVSITDGVQVARAISFFTITDGKIFRLVEYWPDPFEAAPNRSHLVEKME
jgi:ketosteroid isomerase-like protein